MRGKRTDTPIVQLLADLYLSKQFLLYVLCGLVSSLVQVVARWVLNHYMGFSGSVFFAYFVAMLVAFYLYKVFVFDAYGGASSRAMILFALAYFGLFPLTWGLSVLAEGPLLSVFEPDWARLLAHLIGITVPVLLNFAYNKFITFSRSP